MASKNSLNSSKRPRNDIPQQLFAIFFDFDCTISLRHLFKTMRKWEGAMDHFKEAFPSYISDEEEDDSGNESSDHSNIFNSVFTDPDKTVTEPETNLKGKLTSSTKSLNETSTAADAMASAGGSGTGVEYVSESSDKHPKADTDVDTCPSISLEDPRFILYIFGGTERIKMLDEQFMAMRILGAQLFITTHGFGLEVKAALEQVKLLKHFVGIQAADGLWDRTSGFRATEYARPKMVWIEDTIRAIGVAPDRTWFADDSLRNYDTRRGSGMLPSSGKPIHVLPHNGTFQQDGEGLSECHLQNLHRAMLAAKAGRKLPTQAPPN